MFVPQAIAATALAVIELFVYSPAGIGLLNAILGLFGAGPVSWLGDERIVNISLIVVGVWGAVGFAAVILSMTIKGISAGSRSRTNGQCERVPGLPQDHPADGQPADVGARDHDLGVIKLFDLIYVMTGGGPGTASRVIAFTMYQVVPRPGQYGRGATVAMIMLVILIPIMAFNVRASGRRR